MSQENDGNLSELEEKFEKVKTSYRHLGDSITFNDVKTEIKELLARLC